jgi:hypothetical protein
MRTVRLGVVFDIVLDLSALRIAETDDAAVVAAVHESDEVEATTPRNEPRHASLFILESAIDPNQRLIPFEILGQRQRQAMPCSVELVLGWVELDDHRNIM